MNCERFGDLRLRLSVNGELRQDALVEGDMLYRPLQALQALTRFQNLAAGDLVLTGTPAGTALSAPPKPIEIIGNLLPPAVKWKAFFKRQASKPQVPPHGDVVEASVATDDGAIDLGTQRTAVAIRVTAAPPRSRRDRRRRPDRRHRGDPARAVRRRGLVLDRWPDVYPQPRAVHLDDEIYRIVARLGIADEFAAISRPALGLRLLDSVMRVLAEFRRDTARSVHGFPQANMFDQPEFEALLRNNLKRGTPAPTLRGDAEVTGAHRDRTAACGSRSPTDATAASTPSTPTTCWAATAPTASCAARSVRPCGI